MFSVIKIGKMSTKNSTPQMLQLNLLSMPSLANHQGAFNFELHAKRLSQGQIQINVRHMTKRGVVRDFISTVTDQRELYQQLVQNGMVGAPGLHRQIYSKSLFWYKQSR